MRQGPGTGDLAVGGVKVTTHYVRNSVGLALGGISLCVLYNTCQAS